MQLHHELKSKLDVCQTEYRGLEDECAEAVEEMQEKIQQLREEVELQQDRADYLEKENRALKMELSKANQLCTRGDNPEGENTYVRKSGSEETEDEDGMQRLIARFHGFPDSRVNSSDLGCENRDHQPTSQPNPQPTPQPSRSTAEHEYEDLYPHLTQQNEGRGFATDTPRDPFFVMNDGLPVSSLEETREHKRRRLDGFTDIGPVPQLPEPNTRAPVDYKGKGRAIDS